MAFMQTWMQRGNWSWLGQSTAGCCVSAYALVHGWSLLQYFFFYWQLYLLLILHQSTTTGQLMKMTAHQHRDTHMWDINPDTHAFGLHLEPISNKPFNIFKLLTIYPDQNRNTVLCGVTFHKITSCLETPRYSMWANWDSLWPICNNITLQNTHQPLVNDDETTATVLNIQIVVNIYYETV